MILTSPDILKFIEQGGILNAKTDEMDGMTIDLHFSNLFEVEVPTKGFNHTYVNLAKGEKPGFKDVEVAPGNMFKLNRNGFCMAKTVEWFNMPLDTTGLFYMKSTDARAGLDHSQAIILKPGWSGNLVLEIKNNLSFHTLLLTPGDACGQVMFFRHKPTQAYAGMYNLQDTFTGSSARSLDITLSKIAELKKVGDFN